MSPSFHINLVHQPVYIVGISVTVVLRNKASFAGNGVAIVKSYNAVVECYCSARRVGLSAPMAALRLLPRATAILCEPCLA